MGSRGDQEHSQGIPASHTDQSEHAAAGIGRKDHNVAIVIVSHLNKSPGTKASYRVTGSGAFVAAVRAAWLVVRDPDDETRQQRLMLAVKGNLA